LRTAIASVGLGLAVAKLTDGTFASIGGVAFIALGLMILIHSCVRYMQVLHLLETGYFEANKSAITIITVLTTAACGFALLVAVFDD
jgi:hypothetical protein